VIGYLSPSPIRAEKGEKEGEESREDVRGDSE